MPDVAVGAEKVTVTALIQPRLTAAELAGATYRGILSGPAGATLVTPTVNTATRVASYTTARGELEVPGPHKVVVYADTADGRKGVHVATMPFGVTTGGRL